MPSRAYTSFLHNTILKPFEIDGVSFNALSGLYLISTAMVFGDVIMAILVVSMPSRAYTSFLLYFRRVRGYKNCVNALSGLYLISTYPFKNLSFMRFPEPVFAGIYQNILTTAVFRAC